MKSYGNSSTSTLREHLVTTHAIVCDDNEDDDDDKDQYSDRNESMAAAAAPMLAPGGPRSSGCPGTAKSITKLVGKGMKQMKLAFRKKLDNFEPFTNKYELSRDLVVWAALDLEPFMFVNKSGTRFFFEKNFPAISLPSRNTLSRTALYDVCETLRNKVKEDLSFVVGRTLCIMFDGWSDKHKRYPYIGLRVSFINKDWTYRLITVSLKVLEKHTAENMSSHVRQELATMGINLQTVEVFTTHDGAANMVKASGLLRSAHFQHCIAHCLHLLLMTDGINAIPDLVELLNRCKTAVQRLDAKCCLVENAQTKVADRKTMDIIQEKISRVHEVISADENISLGIDNSLLENNGNSSNVNAYGDSDNERSSHKHSTLKQSNLTRWNSVLYMIDSILTLWNEMNDALKSNGDRDLCLTDDDKIVLAELRQFLKPFGDLTDLVSSEAPHLSLMPLIIREVKDAAAKQEDSESDVIRLLKDSVLSHVDKRLRTDDVVHVASLLDPSLKTLMVAQITHPEAKNILCSHTKRAVDRLNASKTTISGPGAGKSSEIARTRKRSSTNEIIASSTSASSTSSIYGSESDGSGPSGSSSSAIATATNSFENVSSFKMKLLEKFNVKEVQVLSTQIENEVIAYLGLELLAIPESPLTFWKQQENNYPHLAVLARNYLSISSSSVAVEGMFSIAGLLLNSKRSRMAPYKANMLSFVHDNYPKYFPVTKVKDKIRKFYSVSDSDSD